MLGQVETSLQSAYKAKIPSAQVKGLSPTIYTYSPSEQQLGQYIKRQASKVDGSANSIPIYSASFRAIGSYSSAVTVRSSGSITRSLGAEG